MWELVRNDLIDLTRRLLIGPLHVDEVIPSSPGDTYLTGILWPEGQTLSTDEDDNSDSSVVMDDVDTDTGVPGYRAIRPCSIGLTIAVDADAIIEVSLGETSRYEKQETRDKNQKDYEVRWVRRPLTYSLEIPNGGDFTRRYNKFEVHDGTAVLDDKVELHVKRRTKKDKHILTVTLINKAVQSDGQHRDESCLFQTELKVRATLNDGSAAISYRPPLQSLVGNEDAQSAALIYRESIEYAAGHGIATKWTDDRGTTKVSTVWTSWMPEVSVKSMSADGSTERMEEFLATYPDGLNAAWLSDRNRRTEICNVLDAFCDIYAQWIDETLTPRIDSFTSDQGEAARRNLSNCLEACNRMRAGVEHLLDDNDAWNAFALANLAMDRQAHFEVKRERKGPLIWRPFQLAYFLLVIHGLSNLNDASRECVDLLWFPTGGGKTEAYLTLTAFQIFLRRLRSEQRRTDGGVDVLMRYTLRLLTIQQFQRAASLICACELIRREQATLGTAPISLGLYVGADATPNRVEPAFNALEDENAGRSPRSTPRQLLECPVCGNDLPPSSYRKRDDAAGIDITCANGNCQFAGVKLPVQTVDDFIYAEPPSLLIGTVDKFAQLPRRQDIRSIFGLDGGERPSLIIQDELHLISGPLGSMSGLYETVVDLLCTEDGIRPKIIGSTATIGHASRQIRALFDRNVLQFPPSGFDASDSFFAVRDEAGPDRVYLGLTSAGRSPKFALQASTAALLQAAEQLKHDGSNFKDLDPYWTAVIYFNSLRELGGAHVLLQDDIPRHMSFLTSRLTSDKRKLERPAVELSSRVASRELPEYLSQLEASLEAHATDPFSNAPRDAVLASNMISVGVDISRLGLMIVNGQPKTTAEYIQASSRVGRGIPGLVLTLYNANRPRDISHYEHFSIYHEALYRGIEASSVTPWAPRARDKALHAIFVSAIRHLVTGMSGDDSAIWFDPNDPHVSSIVEFIVSRAKSSSRGIETADTRDSLEQLVIDWARKASTSQADRDPLRYWERKAPIGRKKPHLMTSAEEGVNPSQSAWPTPNSMREVEPSTAFILKQIKRRSHGQTNT